jgi:2-dehydro-3-deoxygluconokinase
MNLTTSQRPIDVLTVGESMIRLSVPQGHLLSVETNYEVNVAGAESNVSVGLARLGYHVRWLSRLTDNVLGRRIVQELGSQGVDCSSVVWTDQDRIGTYYVEFGATPRPTQVLYDRANSAASNMTADTFDLAQVEQAKVLHLTGITAAISDGCYQLIEALLDTAKRVGTHVVFDVNFRGKLWTPEQCAAKLSPLFDRVDTLLLSWQDAQTVFSMSGEPEKAIYDLRNRFKVSQIGLTVAQAGAIGLAGGSLFKAAGYPVQIVDRIGAGDAFAAGVISGLLRDDFELGLRYGVAMSALQLTLRGDMFRLGKADVERLIESGNTTSLVR